MKYLKAKRWEIMLFVLVIEALLVYTSTLLIAKVYGFFILFPIFRHTTMHCYENGSYKIIILAAVLNTLLLSAFCSWKIAVTLVVAFIWGWFIGVKHTLLKSEVISNVQ